jgi:hypothetical protein
LQEEEECRRILLEAEEEECRHILLEVEEETKIVIKMLNKHEN